MASAQIWAEYYQQASKPSVQRLLSRHDVTTEEFSQVLGGLLAACVMISPIGEAPACRDEDDRKYLHCTLTGNVPWLITRDRDLLDEPYRVVGTTILTPEGFLAAIESHGADLED